MSRPLVNPRVVINSVILLVAAVIAHTLACGTFIPALPFLAGSLLIILAVTVLSTSKFQGASIAAIVALVQTGTHFFLGSGRMSMPSPTCGGSSTTFFMPTGSSMNSHSMLIVHFMAGIASYIFIRNNEKFWICANRCLVALLVPDSTLGTIPEITLAGQSKIEITVLITRLQSFLTEATSRLAAPPSFPSFI